MSLSGPAVPVVSVVDERLRSTCVCYATIYGARHDPPGRGGRAHLLEHLLMSAPGGHSASFSERVERRGGHANAETGLEAMLFYAQVHPDDAGEVTSWLYESVLSPAPDDEDLERERAVVIQELAAVEADPSDDVQDAFLATVFDGHPLGRPVGGTPAEVAAMTLRDVIGDYRHAVLGWPGALVVVGPAAPATVARELPVAPGPTPTPVPTGWRPGPPPEPQWPDDFSWTCLGSRFDPSGNPPEHAYTILAALLGASPSSLLYRRLRNEAGLAYSFVSWARRYTDAGVWRLLAGTEGANGAAMVALVRDTLEEVATRGPELDDLAAARRQAELRVILDTETPLEHARQLARRSRAGTVHWSLDQEVAAIRAVPEEHVRAAAAVVREGLTAVVRPRAAGSGG